MTGWQDHKQQFQQQQVQELLEQKIHQLQLQVQQQQQQAQQKAQQEAEQQCPVRTCSVVVSCDCWCGCCFFFDRGLVCGWKFFQVSATSKDAGRTEEGVSLTRSCNFVQFYPLLGQMVRSSPQMMVWFDTKTVQATIDRGVFFGSGHHWGAPRRA